VERGVVEAVCAWEDAECSPEKAGMKILVGLAEGAAEEGAVESAGGLVGEEFLTAKVEMKILDLVEGEGVWDEFLSGWYGQTFSCSFHGSPCLKPNDCLNRRERQELRLNPLRSSGSGRRIRPSIDC
jgi:hypothetical protein